MPTYETAVQESDEQTTELPCDPEDGTVADTGSGLLVDEVEREYWVPLGREKKIARRLIGFADVTDWDAIAGAVRARGWGHGDVLHLLEFALDQLPETAQET